MSWLRRVRNDGGAVQAHHGGELMRINSAHSRARVLIFIAALSALATLPAAASAAPKKAKIGFSAPSYTVIEGNAFNVTVVRTGNTRFAASVSYTTLDGTATAPGDYTATSGTLNFAAGETRKTVSVPTTDNAVAGPASRTLTLRLSNGSPDSVPPGKANATLRILDNDGPGTIDFSSASYSVVEGAGVATITVTRASASNLIESVDYTTTALAAGSTHATPGTDYTTTTGTLTFGVNEMSKSFQVSIADDWDAEDDETLDLTLSNPRNLSAPLGTQPVLGTNNPATLTIVDDDIATFSFSAPTYSVDEDDPSGIKTITVNRGGAANVAADIAYSVDPDPSVTTATGGGTDYTLASGTLHFAAGETSKTFDVTIVDDSNVEGNETIGLRLTDSGTVVSTALLSIVDDDVTMPSVQFSNVAYSVNEAATTATVTVTLSEPAVGGETVDYDTTDGTATNGATNPDGSGDYVDTHGTLTFTAGQSSQTIDIPLNPDDVIEDDEAFSIALSNESGLQLGDPHDATVTIHDDDGTGTLEFSALRYDVNETGANAVITVNRVGGSAGTASVDYATSDGTAHAPGDYTATSGTLSFGSNETQKTFVIPIAWDGLAEGDETVSIGLSNFVSDDDLGITKAAVLHIADSGASGPVQFSAGSYTVAENGGPATITVTRSGNLGGPVTVDYATSDGTAHAGTDYTESHGTLTFGPGETSKTFQVPVTDDTVRQGARSVNLTLSNPGGGTAVGTQGTAALDITDNEPVSSASTDRTAPTLKLTAKKLQKALKAKRFTLKVRSNEAAKLVVTIKARKSAKSRTLVTVAKASKTVAAGKTVTIKVKLTKKAIAKLRKALAKGKVKIRVTVKGTDAANNSASVTKVFTIR
jgi:hypothetical protein